MARSMTMAPQAPRPTAPQAPRSTAKTAPAAHPNGGHPAHPQKHPSPSRHGGNSLWAVLLILALAAAAGAWWVAHRGGPAEDPGALLLTQMEAAARGSVAPAHAFGGTLSVERANGRMNVVADGVPSRACVQVGWRLARSGTIIVNGTLSPRLSAAKLSELCSGDSATLLWVPDE